MSTDVASAVGPAWVMAVGGLLSIIFGYVMSRRGARDTAIQQKAAHALSARIQSFEEIKQHAALAEAAATRASEEATKLREVMREVEADAQRRLDWQADRCTKSLRETTEALALLRLVVINEIDRSAAQDAIDQATRHLALDHPPHEHGAHTSHDDG